MPDSSSIHLDIGQLRVGLHVQLDLGWMSHPFARNSFRIASEEQLRTLRSLGLSRVRVSLPHSDADALQALNAPAPVGATEPPAAAAPAETAEQAARRARRAALEAEQALAAQAERQYAEAGRVLKRVFDLAPAQPQVAREHCEAQLHQVLDKLLDADEVAIRLVGETGGDRACLHGVNVAVLALLLGQQLGLDKTEMFDLGLGALLHDIGKQELPERMRWLDPVSAACGPAHERHYYEEHVPRGVALGRAMALPAGALLVLAQHHELADGSGFPLHLHAAKTSLPARIVALVNRYDNYCNPSTPAAALTPHEALALLYGQMRGRFDATVFAGFIRMLGVYPPGSLVQLNDERYAMVITVNAARPLKPCLLVHDAKAAREDALTIDLEAEPTLGIRRSLKPEQLPRAVLDWLSPRPRVCYFFERARAPRSAAC